jgi:hypothetical protein
LPCNMLAVSRLLLRIHLRARGQDREGKQSDPRP